MASITKYASNITQATGTTVCSYSGLNNLKNANNSFAKTALIGKKSETKKNPPTITCKGFNFNLPAHVKINKITVEYAHQKLAETAGKYPSIAKATANLVGFSKSRMATSSDGVSIDFPSMTGVTPTKDLKDTSVAWSDGGKISMHGVTAGGKVTTVTYTYRLPTVTQVNNADFGVSIDYPPNTNNYRGYLQLKYIRIKIDYTPSEYAVSVTRIAGTLYEDYPQTIQLNVSNLNSTDYQNSYKIQIPASATVRVIGTVFQEGQWTPQGNNVFIWKPYQKRDLKNLQLDLGVTFKEGENSVILTELLNNVTDTLTLTVPPVPIVIPEPVIGVDTLAEETIFAVQNEYCTIPLEIPEGATDIWFFCDKAVTYKIGESVVSKAANSIHEISSSLFVDNKLDIQAKFADAGVVQFFFRSYETQYKYIKVIPSGLEGLQICCIPLSEEELDRLGDEYTYEVSCFIEILLDVQNHYDKFHDYYRNFRIGVVNSIEATHNINTIFNACKEWSSVISVYNSFQEKKINFTYNKDYPVYVLLTGGYSIETPYINTKFSHICIQESDYDDFKEHGIFPEPIENLIIDENMGELTLQNHATSNDIIFYKFPFEDDFGTGEDYAIRGIELQLRCDTNEKVVCNAKLKSPSGEMGLESIILQPGTDTYTIGSQYDSWGFMISDLVNIKFWELILTFNNIIGTDNINPEINITDVLLTVYFLKLDEGSVEKVYIDGENLEWYGAFIQDFKMISGIKTDTKFLEVEGTDINDAYSQTIDTKEITIEFDIDGCNLRESTDLLKQITKLITTKRDNLNRPIPKQITTSIYPDEYWEYVLEDGVENEVEYTGYKCKVKLTVSAGTSYAKEDTVTNTTGMVNSITKVNPIIVIIPTGETVEITEENTDQKWTATHPDWINKMIEIDCEHRAVTIIDDEDSDDEDISWCADWNTDWFILDDMYNFTGVNCIIQTVTTTGRW